MNKHSFDKAKQGYVNFLTGAGTQFTSDTPAMVQARERFQNAGFYEPLRERLAETAGGVVLDAGCGTGYYAAAAPYTQLLATDLSKSAVQRAARLPRSFAFVWDIWQSLPLMDGVCDTVLNVFAPHNFAEFRRVVRPGGQVVVVTAGDGHLESLRDAGLLLGQGASKLADLDEKAAMPLEHRGRMRVPLSLSPEDAVDLAFMGPAGHHATRDDLAARLASAQGAPTETEAVFDISVFRN